MKLFVTVLFASFLSTAQAGVVAEFLKVLPAGTHQGQDCQVQVMTEANALGVAILAPNGDTIVSHHFYESSDFEVEAMSFARNKLELEYTKWPDDGYTGKDKIRIEYKNKKFKMRVRDYGPAGVLFSQKRGKCKLK